MAEGIDVSSHQGVINWQKVAASGQQYAFARSSLASRTKDDFFVPNYKGMVEAGLIPGAYHVVGKGPGAEQAANWKDMLDAAGFDKGMLALDVEGWSDLDGVAPATILNNIEYLAKWVQDTYQRTPVMYTGYYWRDYLKQHSNNFGSVLWLAAYVTDPVPYIPSAWSDYHIWQYTSSGQVNGVVGNVDRNKSKGTLVPLKKLAGITTITEPEQAVLTAEEVQAIVDNALVTVNSNLSQLAEDMSRVMQTLVSLRDNTNTLIDQNGTIRPQIAQTQEFVIGLQEDVDALRQTVLERNDPVLLEAVERMHKHVCTRVDLH